MPNGVEVAWPWNSHSSTPRSLRTTFGTASFHFAGTWFSYMSGGSTMWSSMLTRIMSSICMATSLRGSGRAGEGLPLQSPSRGPVRPFLIPTSEPISSWFAGNPRGRDSRCTCRSSTPTTTCTRRVTRSRSSSRRSTRTPSATSRSTDARRSPCSVRSASTSRTRPSTSWPGPARRRSTTGRAIPTGRATATSSASRSRRSPRSASRRPAWS